MAIYDHQTKFDYLVNRPEIGMEIINFVCGDLIGQGCYRDVFEYNLDDKFVVKICRENDASDNYVEWRIWNSVKYTTDGTKDWFAPCEWISTNGRVLLQRRTQPLSTKEKLIPEKIPAYFTDVKAANFGWIGNKLVAHDYSHCLEKFGSFATNRKKMQPFKREVW